MPVDIKEMMIGNLFLRGGIVVMIDANNIITAEKEKMLGGEGYEGLPLSALIMEQFAFTISENYPEKLFIYHKFFGNKKYILQIRFTSNWSRFYSEYTDMRHTELNSIAENIFYAHELQNIWKAITKENLERKL